MTFSIRHRYITPHNDWSFALLGLILVLRPSKIECCEQGLFKLYPEQNAVI